MRVRELMVGDWVMNNGNPIKVENIHGNFINYSPDIPYVQEEDYLNENEIEPIPLTPEILEKNGFVYESDGLTWYDGIHNKEQVYIYCPIRKNGNVRKIEILVNKYHFFTELNTEYYVHELQHALRLRLCGLNDLADNFKI